MELHEAQQALDDATQRRALFEWLWTFTRDAQCEIPRPCPTLSDERIEAELKRILFPKKKRFFGLF